MRSLGVSIFIVLFFFSASVTNQFSAELQAVNPENNGLIVMTEQMEPTADSVGLNGSIEGLSSLDLLDRPANELEKQGGEYGSLSMTKVLTSVLINSTTGFGDYIRNFLGVETGSSTSYVIELVQWMVILNHAIAILQLLNKPIGGSL